MSEQKFEIAFSGEIAEGADPAAVKQRVGAVFKADEAKLEQMFSGKRMIIKREVDEVTAAKYRGAFQKAGAVCEVRPLSAEPTPAEAAPTASAEAPAAQASSAAASGDDYVSRYPESEAVPQALLTDPLGITGEQIGDLGADIAPVGSAMQDNYEDPEEPGIDISGMDVAPVGATLDEGPEEPTPPPPDTRGITMAD